VTDPGLPPEALEDVARALADEAGLSLAGGLGAALRDGVVAAAAARGESPAALARSVIARDPAALAALLEHAVVTETAFWRHPEGLLAVARRLGKAQAPVRIWSAGCASGEEAYSLGGVLLEAGRSGADGIVATDVSERALAAARLGAYRARALRKLPAEAAARWLEPEDADGLRRVRRPLRALVTFARQNLVRDPPPAGAPFDAVLCRNVLIYFEPKVAAAVLYRLVAALRPGGMLVLGPVELPLAAALPLDWIEEGGATVLVRRG